MLRMEDSSTMSHGLLCKIMWVDSGSELNSLISSGIVIATGVSLLFVGWS